MRVYVIWTALQVILFTNKIIVCYQKPYHQKCNGVKFGNVGFQLWAKYSCSVRPPMLKSRKGVLKWKKLITNKAILLFQRPKKPSSPMAGSRGLDPDFRSWIREFEIRILRIQ